jgi:hypothetical protein
MEPINQTSKEFHALEKYAKETHGATHQHYTVNVVNAFRVERYIAWSQPLPRSYLTVNQSIRNGSLGESWVR